MAEKKWVEKTAKDFSDLCDTDHQFENNYHHKVTFTNKDGIVSIWTHPRTPSDINARKHSISHLRRTARNNYGITLSRSGERLIQHRHSRRRRTICK